MGCIGKDKFGEEMKKNSKATGVNVSFLVYCDSTWLSISPFRLAVLFLRPLTIHGQVHYREDETVPTGTCAVCIVGGERSVPNPQIWKNVLSSMRCW